MAAKKKAPFADDLNETICQRIAEGESLVDILKEKGMPGYSTFMHWLSEDEQLRENYARAREAQGDADADKINHIARGVLSGEYDPSAANVAINALKWTAAKRQPKKYGDKLDLNHGGSISIERVVVDFMEDGDANR